MSPVHLYRATAQCSACGKVVDVGPFDVVPTWAVNYLPGWLLEGGGAPPAFILGDAFGTRFAVCPECMERPLKDVIQAITDRHGREEP